MLSEQSESFLADLASKMNIPGEVSAFGITPFVVAFVLSLVASALFVRYYWKSHEHDRPAAVIATLGLWIAMLTAFLLPVDVFLVSFMKTDDGKFKPWAQLNTTRDAIEQSVAYAYLVLYGTICFFVFFLLPLVYFAHEEQDEDRPDTTKRFVSALKYTVVFVIACILIFIVGALIPYKKVTDPSKTGKWVDEIYNIFERMYNDSFTTGLLFVLNILIFMGTICLIIYLGTGLSVYPVNCIRGFRSLRDERQRISERRSEVVSRTASLRSRESTLSSRDKRLLSKLQEEERVITLMESELNKELSSPLHKLRYCTRLFGVLFGIVGIILGFMIWLSVLLANINRLMYSLGYENGYIVTEFHIINPLDWTMMHLQKVFPLDYIMFFGIIVFLVTCTIAGVRYLGIWCFCVRLFRIRPHRTRPQGLIMLCTIVMFTVLALNVLIYAALPQYMTFGDQKYVQQNETTGKVEVKPCISTVSKDLCVMTRASTFLLNFAFALNSMIFGLCYYWMTWIFLLMVVISFIVSIIKKKRSSISEAVDRDDFEESDDDVQPLIP